MAMSDDFDDDAEDLELGLSDDSEYDDLDDEDVVGGVHQDEEDQDAEAREALRKQISDINNYREFVKNHIVSKAQRTNAKAIEDACFPKDRMLLVVKLERYLDHLLEQVLSEMLETFAAKDWPKIVREISATDASVLFDLFWGYLSKSWALVHDFPQCMKKPIEAIYQGQNYGAYNAGIWGDVVQFGITACQTYETKLEHEERRVIRKVITRGQAEKKEAAAAKLNARKTDNWWDDEEATGEVEEYYEDIGDGDEY